MVFAIDSADVACGFTYLVLTMVVHQQYQLLMRRLTDCANAFVEQGCREQHRFP
ncbi:MAG: hypothetical protein R2932_22845 [Caldilineaceae bacterium]